MCIRDRYETEFSGGPFSACYGRNFDKNTTSTGSYKEVKRSVKTTTEAPSLSCSGTTSEGYCWHKGELGESCTEVCAGYGGNLQDCGEDDPSGCPVCRYWYPGDACTIGGEITTVPHYDGSCRRGWAIAGDCHATGTVERFCVCCE